MIIKQNINTLYKEGQGMTEIDFIQPKKTVGKLISVDVLDKIRAEIENTLYVDSLIFRELIDFRNGKISADDVIEEFNRVTRAEVLQIIDKYKVESEDKK